jgi:hypothetical protein
MAGIFYEDHFTPDDGYELQMPTKYAAIRRRSNEGENAIHTPCDHKRDPGQGPGQD